MSTTRPILIAYDGSLDARHAIDEAAAKLAPGPAIVVYVRQPLESMAAHLEGHPALEQVRAVELSDRDAAEQLAEAGAEYARERGFDADARVASTSGAVADTIVSVADELDAALIVLGSRGYRGLKSLLLGGVSHHVVHHARRPVLVAPSPALITARTRAAEAVDVDRPQAAILG